MDCSKCREICKSECCMNVPFDRDFLLKNLKRRVRGIIRVEPILSGAVVPVTEDGYCPFLNEDFSCAIYSRRPKLCRDFGMGNGLLRCQYQDRDGRIRSRQERRSIARAIDKRADTVIKTMKEMGKKLKNKGL